MRERVVGPFHAYAMSIYFMHYNFVRIHRSLRVTPATRASVTTNLWSLTDTVRVIEECEDLRSGRCWLARGGLRWAHLA